MNIIKFMKLRNNPINNSIPKSIAALLLAAGLCPAFMPVKSFASTTDSFALTEAIAVDDKDFNENFREGRDLIDKEQWAQAAKKFNELVAKYSDHKSADAALYWLAFCYKKQKLYKETDATLDRLLEKFAASSWANDARVMKMEIAAPLGKWNTGNVFLGAASTLPAGVYTTPLPNNTTTTGAMATTLPAAQVFDGFASYNKMITAPTTPLDREDEIKIAAFQSLLSIDAKRSIDALGRILESNSKASETLKIEALRTMRRPRLTGNYTSSESLIISSSGSSLDKEAISLLREVLFKNFKGETNAKVRREIIYTLANLKDEQSTEYLVGLYKSESDREVKKAIINGFGAYAGNGFTIANLYEKNSKVIVSNGSSAAQVKNSEYTKLLEILKTEKDIELKTLALVNLQRFENWNAEGKNAETLIQIYDSETNEDFKKSIIQSLAKTKQSAVLKKLFDIAKNDKSDKLRLEAVYNLRNSKDPEALKFLEELIK